MLLLIPLFKPKAKPLVYILVLKSLYLLINLHSQRLKKDHIPFDARASQKIRIFNSIVKQGVGLNVNKRASHACICFSLLEVNNLGSHKSNSALKHFLDFESQDETFLKSENTSENFCPRTTSFLRFSQETSGYFVGCWRKFTGNKIVPFAQILEPNQPSQILARSNIFQALVSSIKSEQIWKDYAFQYLKAPSQQQLKSNLLNVFVRGGKGTGKSTLSLALLNRLLATENASSGSCIKGTFIFLIISSAICGT